MKTSLKTVANVIGIRLPRSGGFGNTIERHRVNVFCGSGWARRKVISIRVYALMGKPSTIGETVRIGKWIASRVFYPVDVEAGKMFLQVTPDGQVKRHPNRFVVKPHCKIP